MADYSRLFGALFDKKETDRIVSTLPYPILPVMGVDESKGKTRMLFECYNKVVEKNYVAQIQETSDCVAVSSANAIDILRCVQHIIDGTYESFNASTSSEIIYGGSRNEIGRGSLGRGGGSMGVWAAQWGQKYGYLQRGKYGKYDLTNYNLSLTENWAVNGVPDELEVLTKEHLLKEFTPIRTWEEARRALYNWSPITVACNQGFSNVRDKDGFARPQGVWPHQQAVLGFRDDHRPGVLIQNSWGAWNSGPKTEFNIPDGSYFCDADVFERNMLSAGDSFAYSLLKGWEPVKIDLSLF